MHSYPGVHSLPSLLGILRYTRGCSLACQAAHPLVRYANEVLQHHYMQQEDRAAGGGEDASMTSSPNSPTGASPASPASSPLMGSYNSGYMLTLDEAHMMHHVNGFLDDIAHYIRWVRWWLLRPCIRAEGISSPIPLHLSVVSTGRGSLKRLKELLKQMPFLDSVLQGLDLDPEFVKLDAQCMSQIALCSNMRTLSLHTLAIADYSALVDLPALEKLVLTGLELKPSDVDSLTRFSHPPVALSLRLKLLAADVTMLASVPALSELDLSDSLTDELGALVVDGDDDGECFPNLRALHLENCVLLENFDALASLHRIEALYVGRNALIDHVDWIKANSNLKVLSVRSCRSLEDISPLRRLSRTLVEVSLESTAVDDLHPLGDCQLLQRVDVSSCWCLATLTPLGKLPALECVRACRSSIVDVEALGRSLSLEKIYVRHCPQLRSLSPLGEVSSLRVIAADGSGIRDIDGLRQLVKTASLRVLSLDKCYTVADWSPADALQWAGTRVFR